MTLKRSVSGKGQLVDLRFCKSGYIKFVYSVFLFTLFFLSPAFSAGEDVLTVKLGVFEASPLIFTGDDGGGEGVFVDVLKEVARQEGWEIEYVAGTFAEGLERIKNGEVDLMGSVMHMKDREAFLDFTENSILNVWGQVYVGVDSEISMIFDLKGKAVGVMKGGAHGTNFMKMSETFGIDCEILLYDNFSQITEALLSGEIEAGVYANFHGYKYQQEGVLKQTSIIFNPTKLKFAAAKGANQHLLNAIDIHFAKWKSDSKSEYYEILDKWFHLKSKEVLPGWVVKLIYIAGMVLIVVVTFIFILRHQVRVRTEALLSSREQRKRIVDSLIDTFLYRHDVEGVFNYVSSSVTQVLGYSTDVFLTHYTKYLTDDPINLEAVKHTEESIKGIRQPSFELQIFHKDRSIRWLQVSETPVFDKEGKVVAVEGVAHDITDRKLWEEALRQLTETTSGQLNDSFFKVISIQLAKALNADYVLVGELSGNENGSIKTVAVVADGEPADNFEYELSGTPCENVVGKEVCSYGSGVAEQFPTDTLLADMGVEGYVGVPLFDSQGEALGVMATLFRKPIVNADFAEAILQIFSSRVGSELERMQAEIELLVREQQLRASNQQLRANEQEREVLVHSLKYKNKELQDIVYTASHDLKSPLVNISGFSGQLNMSCGNLEKLAESIDQASSQDEIKKLIENEIPESLGFITSSVGKMKSLIDGLLRISRIGTAEINSVDVDMNELFREVRGAMEFQLQEHAIRFRVCDIPACKGDRELLNQVFTNLIDNAIKYREPSRETVIEVSGRVDGEDAVYSVKDNGRGVEPEYKGKVFEIFHRLEPGEDIVGEGLGLTIVTRIVDRLGGRIWLESEAGAGCEFFVALPKG